MKNFAFCTFAYFMFKTLETLDYFKPDKKVFVLIKCLPIIYLSAAVLDKFDSLQHLKRNKHGFNVFIALIISSIADALLVYDEDTIFFLAGLGMFLLAIIFYMNAFGWKKLKLEFLPITFFSSALTYYYVFWKSLNVPNEIKLGCLVYTLVGQTAIWRAWARVEWKNVRKGNYKDLLAGVGVISFAISDTVLAVNKFSFPIPYIDFIVMPTYYFAQFLISSAVQNNSKKNN